MRNELMCLSGNTRPMHNKNTDNGDKLIPQLLSLKEQKHSINTIRNSSLNEIKIYNNNSKNNHLKSFQSNVPVKNNIIIVNNINTESLLVYNKPPVGMRSMSQPNMDKRLENKNFNQNNNRNFNQNNNLNLNVSQILPDSQFDINNDYIHKNNNSNNINNRFTEQKNINYVKKHINRSMSNIESELLTTDDLNTDNTYVKANYSKINISKNKVHKQLNNSLINCTEEDKLNRSGISAIHKYTHYKVSSENEFSEDRLRSISNINYKNPYTKSNINENVLNKSNDIIFYKKKFNMNLNFEKNNEIELMTDNIQIKDNETIDKSEIFKSTFQNSSMKNLISVINISNLKSKIIDNIAINNKSILIKSNHLNNKNISINNNII